VTRLAMKDMGHGDPDPREARRASYHPVPLAATNGVFF
jgi:hypothetical protein